MAFAFNTNVLIPGLEDKLGHILIVLKNALVASGRWRVRGSGDGNLTFQLVGQTAGVAGSFDVFTASPAWAADFATVRSNSISMVTAWLVLEEIASGRIIRIQRAASISDSAYLAVSMSAAVATTGATAKVAPAAVGASANLCGTFPGSALHLGFDLNTASTVGHWMQIGVETTLRAGNVTPWFFSLWNRATNAPSIGAIWESLVDVDTAIDHPLVAAFGLWSSTFGTPGNASSGGIYASSQWRGGNALALCTLGYLQNAGIGATSPNYQQLNNAGKFRTERPWLLQPSVGSKHIGRLENIYLNKQARDYPSTYDLSGAQPRLTLGHLIVPWTNVVPESSP